MEHTLGGLDAKAFEELRVSQRKLDELANLGELLAYSTNVIIANVIKAFLILPLDRLALKRKISHTHEAGDIQINFQTYLLTLRIFVCTEQTNASTFICSFPSTNKGNMSLLTSQKMTVSGATMQ